MGLLNIQETINQTIRESKEDVIKSRIREEILQEEKKMKDKGFWYWKVIDDDVWLENETNRRYEEYLKIEKAKKNQHYFDYTRMKESQKWANRHRR